MAAKIVCVTGGSGFIASWLVKALLDRGYFVRASVRDPSDSERTQHLLSLDGAKERLHLFQADLMDQGSFDSGIHGCDGVFHCASPFFIHTQKPEEELIEPAVKGTLNVLASVAKAPSVKRVILTSSEAAMAFNRTPRTSETVIDETWWSDPDYCRENQMWYVLSKTLAERAAWDFVKDKGIDMISINPCCVIGPMLQPTLKTSCAQILSLINKDTCRNASYGWVHVKDVVDAQVLAYEKPEANGRYYIVERCANRLDLANMLSKLYPELKFGTKCGDGQPPAQSYQVNTEKAKKIGVVFTPLEQALKDTVETLKEKGFLKV